MSPEATKTPSKVRVEIRGLSKTFPGTKALKGVDMNIDEGEIHALVGGNGSGKSTLIKILTGVYRGDEGGSIRIGDVTMEPSETTPERAREAAIFAVHQDLGIFPDMSVMENLALGYGYATTAGKVRWRSQRAHAERLLEQFEIDVSPTAPLASLTQAARTQVAIARALQGEGRAEGRRGLLILDEPTASLPAHEVALLMEFLRRYAAQGQAILYVSHRLDEVLDLADRVTVFRDGEKVAELETAGLGEEELITSVVGREVERAFPAMPEVVGQEPLLEVRNLDAGPLRDVDITVRPGEVVGLGGLLGSGRSELLRAIFGDLPVRSGSIVLGGEKLKIRRPSQAMAAGIAHVPENRASDAAFVDLPIWANVSMANVRDYWSITGIKDRRMKADASRAMDEFLVKANSEKDLLSTLSGGNQQKVIVARWLRRKPRLLLLDEPTHGVDVGARTEIYGLIREAVAAGAAAIVVASDPQELAHVSDRVVILRSGRVTGEVRQPNLTAERLTQAAYETEVN